MRKKVRCNQTEKKRKDGITIVGERNQTKEKKVAVTERE